MSQQEAFEEFEDESIEQDLEDLEQSNNWSEGAVLWSTDWTAETVVSQLNRGNINLFPIFQRRSAWTAARQSLFIESLILGLPIPQLILAEDPYRKGSFIVIDGKQRLLSIRAFTAKKESDFQPLKLSGLDKLKHLNKKTYAEIQHNDQFVDELTAFDNSTVRTIVIRNWRDESYLYEVFLRINTTV